MASTGPIVIVGNGTIDQVFSYVNPTLYIGQAADPVTTIVQGTGDTAVTPAAKTYRFTNGSGVDNAAGNATIIAPLSTGAATPARLVFAVGVAHGSDAVLQTATTTLTLAGTGSYFGTPPSVITNPPATQWDVVVYGPPGTPGRFTNVNGTNAAIFRGFRYNGTATIPTAIVNADNLLNIGGGGYDGTNANLQTAFAVVATATENWSNTAHGTKVTIQVVQNTTTALANVLTLDNDLSATFAGTVGIGTAAQSYAGLLLQNSLTATGGRARGIVTQPTLIASANGDTLSLARFGVTAFTPGTFTGLQVFGLEVGAISVAAFTSPADPIGVNVGVVNGTGATNGYALRLGIPTGATNNYLIAATTASTFNVLASGAITGLSITVAGGAFAAGRMYVDGSLGLSLGGVTGSTNDLSFFNPAGSVNLLRNPTGTSNWIATGGITTFGQTAVPAGGTAGKGYLFSSTANLGVFFGSGAPSLAAAQGSLYLRSDGSGIANRLYVNTDGNTTWTNFVTAA